MEFDNVIVKENPGLCRCCLSEGCYKDLGTEYNWMGETEVYADMLMECFDISISQHSDGPNGTKRLLSEVCITRIRDACNFKKQVLDSENKFIDMLGRGEFKSDVLVYRAPMKEEVQIEVNPTQDDGLVEYLDEDMDFMGDKDDDCDKEEPNTSNQEEKVIASSLNTRTMTRIKKRSATTSRVEKKKTVKKAAVKEGRVSKEKTELSADALAIEKANTTQRRKNISAILSYTTAVPFKQERQNYANSYKCFYCLLTFAKPSTLLQHNREEHSDGKFETILINHFRVTSNRYVYVDVTDLKCKFCKFKTNDMEALIEHAAREHGCRYDKNHKSYIPFKLTDGGLNCLVCGKEFNFFNPLLSHTLAEHVNKMAHLCESCGQRFSTSQSLTQHVHAVHHKSDEFRCSYCGESFTSLYRKTSHENRTHKEKIFRCPKCPEMFASLVLRKSHLKSVHKEGWVACDVCGKKYCNITGMLNHKKSAHWKKKNVVCEICGAGFCTDKNLRRHMVSHSSERPYQCGTCLKTFRHKKNWMIHERIHTNDRRCVCKICGAAYIQTTSLKLHMKKHK